jgi:hypothetical protein
MEERSLGTLQTNFDETLFIEVAENFIVQLAKGGEDRSLQGFGLPDITARYHIHAQQAGDENDRYRKQPVDGNPQAQDLITGYWHHARAEVRDFLTSQNPGGFEQEAEIC